MILFMNVNEDAKQLSDYSLDYVVSFGQEVILV